MKPVPYLLLSDSMTRVTKQKGWDHLVVAAYSPEGTNRVEAWLEASDLSLIHI